MFTLSSDPECRESVFQWCYLPVSEFVLLGITKFFFYFLHIFHGIVYVFLLFPSSWASLTLINGLSYLLIHVLRAIFVNEGEVTYIHNLRCLYFGFFRWNLRFLLYYFWFLLKSLLFLSFVLFFMGIIVYMAHSILSSSTPCLISVIRRQELVNRILAIHGRDLW